MISLMSESPICFRICDLFDSISASNFVPKMPSGMLPWSVDSFLNFSSSSDLCESSAATIILRSSLFCNASKWMGSNISFSGSSELEAASIWLMRNSNGSFKNSLSMYSGTRSGHLKLTFSVAVCMAPVFGFTCANPSCIMLRNARLLRRLFCVKSSSKLRVSSSEILFSGHASDGLIFAAVSAAFIKNFRISFTTEVG